MKHSFFWFRVLSFGFILSVGAYMGLDFHARHTLGQGGEPGEEGQQINGSISNACCVTIQECFLPEISCSSFTWYDCPFSWSQRAKSVPNHKKCEIDVVKHYLKSCKNEPASEAQWVPCLETYWCEYDVVMGRCVESFDEKEHVRVPLSCSDNCK
ncbi:MAG: hypothetical protein KatS3mg110_0643 [Pirellulaceae bacterium]|nr:MAG: hypothetical protein KatS3mg110_0643 [Pirellulaceae bacterium]